jgi:hypothetical protein
MSIQHRVRAVRDRSEARGGKRRSQPAEFQRASELPSVSHERPAASSREAVEVAAAPAATPKAPRKKATRRKR